MVKRTPKMVLGKKAATKLALKTGVEFLFIGTMPRGSKRARDLENETDTLRAFQPTECQLHVKDFESLLNVPAIKQSIASRKESPSTSDNVICASIEGKRMEIKLGRFYRKIQKIEILSVRSRKVRIYWTPEHKGDQNDCDVDEDKQ